MDNRKVEGRSPAGHAGVVRFVPASPSRGPSSDREITMESSNMDKVVNTWSLRLRHFRSGDRIDASALLSGPKGVRLMSMAVAAYLADWDNSEWVDAPEIEGLAMDLARLWPNNEDAPQLPEVSSDSLKELHEIFQKAFDSARSGESNLADELRVQGNVAIAN